MTQNPEMRQVVLSGGPIAFWQDLIAVITHAYQSSSDLTDSRYPDYSERQSFLPIARRADIELAIRDLAGSYGLISEARSNRTGSYHHTIVSMETIVFTAHKVSQSGELVRQSIFRNLYAKRLQPDLFETDAPILNGDPKYYCFVLHGPNRHQNDVPGFIQLAFPNDDCSDYLDLIDLVSLVEEYGEQPFIIKKQEEITLPVVTLNPAIISETMKRHML